jgi:DNA repair exonuclease SbcCD ATPase subunit
MILEHLRLRDFCLFRGTQTFDLTPAQRQGKHRPIVLFGGINGGGKTTLFDAIQLALYGSRARCSKRAQHSYEEFLRQSILFSTDTEVDRPHYRALQPALARAYHLDYDEQLRITVGVEGYFWKEA